MGGRSATRHTADDAVLHFAGTLDTRGGGFASVRADFAGGLAGSDALKVRYRGDGKTYKVLLSTGQAGGPWSANPSRGGVDDETRGRRGCDDAAARARGDAATMKHGAAARLKRGCDAAAARARLRRVDG